MIFSFKQFDVKHSGSLLKVNTDAVLLGALVSDKNNLKSILDIGTGCGVIALMLAQKFNTASIDAIEIDEPSYEEAMYNFSRSKFSLQLNAHHISLQNYESKSHYDLIVSNPPYFEVPDFSKGNNEQDIKESRKKFATQFSLTFEELIFHTSKLLNETGKFWVIIPFNAKEQFAGICLNRDLHLQKEILIRSKPGNSFNRCVLSFGREKNSSETNELTIYNADGTRHEEYNEITKEFYL